MEEPPKRAEEGGPNVRQKHVCQLQKTEMCKFFVLNRCGKGARCSFAHALVEIRSKPDLNRTSMCKTFLTTGNCDVPNCCYAHDERELRTTEGFFKTKLCRFAASGRCKHGPSCRFAHSLQELSPSALLDPEQAQQVQQLREQEAAQRSEKQPPTNAQLWDANAQRNSGTQELLQQQQRYLTAQAAQAQSQLEQLQQLQQLQESQAQLQQHYMQLLQQAQSVGIIPADGSGSLSFRPSRSAEAAEGQVDSEDGSGSRSSNQPSRSGEQQQRSPQSQQNGASGSEWTDNTSGSDQPSAQHEGSSDQSTRADTSASVPTPEGSGDSGPEEQVPVYSARRANQVSHTE
ncbi:unnamed protein product, partial [Polarella glacialis]